MKNNPINHALTIYVVLAIFTPSATAETAIQVGAFSEAARVDATLQTLRNAGYTVTTQKVTQHGDELTQVLVGPYPKENASTVLAQLQREGWPGYLVKVPGIPPKKPEENFLLLAQSTDAKLPNSRDALFGDDTAPNKETPPKPENAKDALFGDDLEIPKKQTTTDKTPAGSNLKGFVQEEVAHTIDTPSRWSKILTRAELSNQGRLNDRIKWKLSARLDYDAVYSLYSNNYPSDVRNDQRFNLNLRENYLDVDAGNWEFRLGRQHVVWGEVVGLFFADVVSAKDMREFILPDFDVLRIPQWAARAEYFKDDFHAELLWIPVATYDETGKPGANFFPALPTPPGFAAQYRNEVRPARNINNTNYGLRLSTLKSGWDFSGFYYSSVSASPTFYRDIVTAPQPTFVYEARHDRIKQFGSTVAKDFGTFVLKGEAVYTRGHQFDVTNLTDPGGVTPQNTLDWVASLDFPLPAEARFNLQFYQRVFFNHNPDIIPEKHENGFSILLNGKLASRVEAQVLWIASLNRTDWLLRPNLTWSLEKNLRLRLGVDIFKGQALGLFGQFNNQDRAYTELRYSF